MRGYINNIFQILDYSLYIFQIRYIWNTIFFITILYILRPSYNIVIKKIVFENKSALEVDHSRFAGCHGTHHTTSVSGRGVACNGLTHSCCGVSHNQPLQPAAHMVNSYNLRRYKKLPFFSCWVPTISIISVRNQQCQQNCDNGQAAYLTRFCKMLNRAVALVLHVLKLTTTQCR